MHRDRTDKEFSKKILGKYGKLNDDETLEGTLQDCAPALQKTPRPSTIPRQEAAAETETVRRFIDRRTAGKEPVSRIK